MEDRIGNQTLVKQSPSVIQPVVRILSRHIFAHAPSKEPMDPARFILDGANLQSALDRLYLTLAPDQAEKIRSATAEYLRMEITDRASQMLAQEQAAALRELVLTASASAAEAGRDPGDSRPGC